MPKTLDFAETRDAYSQGTTIQKTRVVPVGQTDAVNIGKDIHLQVARLSSAAAFQQNWPRIILHEVEMAAKLAGSTHESQASGWSEPESVEELAVNPDQVVAFITSGGKKAVVSILRALRNKAAHGEAIRMMTEAIAEVIRSDPPFQSSFAEGENTQRESFIQRAVRLDDQGRTDAALDLIYDSIDEMMRGGQFSELDSLLERLPTNTLSADMLLGVLTATLPARSRLANRKEFFCDVEACLKDRREFEDGLLTGLE